MADERILITGSSGRVGTLLRPLLARPGRVLRLFDPRPPQALPGTGAEEVVPGSVTDLDALVAALQDVDAVLHLGGHSHEAGAEDVLRVDAYGAYCLLEAARRTGVTRILLGSSNHVAGFHRLSEHPGEVPGDVEARPDTLYGWSKVAIESAGRLFHDRFGLDVICLRLGQCFPAPRGPRGLAMWLSPDDCARLVEAAISVPGPGFRQVWGISRNTRRWLSLAEGEAIGYRPEDDAEEYAEKIVAECGEPDMAADPELNRIGGSWCDRPLGAAG
ncbi:NAD-dependent epimerase/dehydratase family protein [Paractinoplanes maris]|uniref:NAD-dependent epimerase/dehydratase family protein n=1 Tax=Paractinoplanes maris TaxID=1734446 RepID=UPI002021AF16|nr:NAD(P)-dependent oxidoreductase [Actinoplanes maris]